MNRSSYLKDYGIDEEIDPKQKFNSLISVTVSTLMCLAAKCPLPEPNVETTKLFLRTVTDDKGNHPRNVKGLLALLNNYSGPYESDMIMEKCFEEHPAVIVEEKSPEQIEEPLKVSKTSELVKEMSPPPDSQPTVKRISKISFKKTEKDSHKKGKHFGSKISPSKSTTSNKT